jgi:hypothetical protein
VGDDYTKGKKLQRLGWPHERSLPRADSPATMIVQGRRARQRQNGAGNRRRLQICNETRLAPVSIISDAAVAAEMRCAFRATDGNGGACENQRIQALWQTLWDFVSAAVDHDARTVGLCGRAKGAPCKRSAGQAGSPGGQAADPGGPARSPGGPSRSGSRSRPSGTDAGPRAGCAFRARAFAVA